VSVYVFGGGNDYFHILVTNWHGTCCDDGNYGKRFRNIKAGKIGKGRELLEEKEGVCQKCLEE
jgi:hypothetical protein